MSGIKEPSRGRLWRVFSLIIFGVGLMLILNSLFGEYDANAAVLFPFIAVSIGNFIDAGITSGAYRKLLNIKD